VNQHGQDDKRNEGDTSEEVRHQQRRPWSHRC
jgi:hypothetical protein